MHLCAGVEHVAIAGADEHAKLVQVMEFVVKCLSSQHALAMLVSTVAVVVSELPQLKPLINEETTESKDPFFAG